MPAPVPIVLAIVVQIVVAWLPWRDRWKVSGKGCNAQSGKPDRGIDAPCFAGATNPVAARDTIAAALCARIMPCCPAPKTPRSSPR